MDTNKLIFFSRITSYNNHESSLQSSLPLSRLRVPQLPSEYNNPIYLTQFLEEIYPFQAILEIVIIDITPSSIPLIIFPRFLARNSQKQVSRFSERTFFFIFAFSPHIVIFQSRRPAVANARLISTL